MTVQRSAQIGLNISIALQLRPRDHELIISLTTHTTCGKRILSNENHRKSKYLLLRRQTPLTEFASNSTTGMPDRGIHSDCFTARIQSRLEDPVRTLILLMISSKRASVLAECASLASLKMNEKSQSSILR